MTIDDANKLLALAKANYSYAFKTMTKQEKVMLVQSWAFALQDIPADIVMLAFMQLLTTSKWLPTVAEIRDRVQGMHYEAEYSVRAEENDILSRIYSPEEKTAEEIEARRVKQYIADQTNHLRGDGAPMLGLNRIINSGYLRAIDDGRSGQYALAMPMAALPETEDE